MPVHVTRRGSQYCVVDASGKVKKGRCHSTKAKATRQMRAINMNLKKRGKI